MSEETVIEEVPRPRKQANSLRDALNRARQQEAERSDVIVDLREAEITRLELLQDALGDVFEALPEDNDLLDCSLIRSTPPRLWIDVLGHVVMGRDKRTYRFLKDTRYGRQVILETTSLDDMAARVTDYVAHRLLERERALESDAGSGMALSSAGRRAEPETGPAVVAPRSGRGWWLAIFWFLLGVLAGAGALFAVGLILTAP